MFIEHFLSYPNKNLKCSQYNHYKNTMNDHLKISNQFLHYFTKVHSFPVKLLG